MINTQKLKKTILMNIPYALFWWAGDKIAYAYRISPGDELYERMTPFMDNFVAAISSPLPSVHPIDIVIATGIAAVAKIIITQKKKNAKQFRHKEEYGSAKWGNHDDIAPYMDTSCRTNNIILTQTEGLTMGKPSAPKYARNKNILVVGGSGSGKTRFVIKPNIMQMHSSYVVTDPKGTILIECGKMLNRGKPTKQKDGTTTYEPYKIKVFNTVDFTKSLHYNPFAYIRPESRETDILKFVDMLIRNTKGEGNSGEDFWVKAERLLYQAYIGMIFTLSPAEEQNIETLIDMISLSECREDDETFKNAIDREFDFLEKWLESDFDENDDEIDPELAELIKIKPTDEQIKIGRFAVKQYRNYKLAAGKTAKSILISCATRLAPFAIDSVLEITSYDEMDLDKLGDELTALFVIISDTDATFNFLVAIMYSQMFNLLCTKADSLPGGKLKYHVRCLLDEFANIGMIPNFEKLIATIRSREISACIVLQALSQLKAIYKDNADTIIGNCDTTLFLGGKESSTLKEMSEELGKATIDAFNTSENRGQSASYGLNYQKLGRELMTRDELKLMDGGKCILQIRGVRPFFSDKYDITRHKQYQCLSDENPNNAFDIEKYVRKYRQRKAIIKPETIVDTYATEINGQEI